MRGPTLLWLSALLAFCLLDLTFAQTLLSEPQPNAQRLILARPLPSKRAFDRVDMSPFDFGAFSKRYHEGLQRLSRRKKSFDRLDQGPFGLVKRKRVFDRVDTGFGFGKRSGDRLTDQNRISLSDLVAQADLMEPLS